MHSCSEELPVPKIRIVFGDLSVDSCWLTSPQLSLSVLELLNSDFRMRSSPHYVGDILTGHPFQPLYGIRGQAHRPTLQTDIFLWGCVVYELMTGFWPGNGQGLSWEEECSLIPRRKWPRLEDEFLGNIVHMCWTGEIRSATELLVTVRRSLQDLGTGTTDNDETSGFNIENLTI